MKDLDEHTRYMQRALELAAVAESKGEVPIGAVLVYQGEIVGEGYNKVITTHDATAHAEMVALREAGQQLCNYRLPETTLYVTLEPCAMCAGALIHARIQNLIFGAFDPKSSAEVVFNSELSTKLNHRVNCQGGILEANCVAVLKDFFAGKRGHSARMPPFLAED